MMPKYISPGLPFILFLFLWMGAPSKCEAQSVSGPHPFWSKVYFGGGIGLGFSNGGFSGSIAPSAVYEVNPYLALGAGLSLSYAKFDSDKYLAYGGSLINLFNPVRFLQLSAELEPLHVHRDYRYGQTDYSRNYWVTGLYLGAGFRTSNVTFGVRYDVLHNNDSYYADAWSPFVRVYF